MCCDSILTSHLHRSAASHCCNYTTALIVSTCVHMQISIYIYANKYAICVNNISPYVAV